MERFRYRHELKFLCSQLQAELLMSQLDCLMDRDAHCGERGFYTVRSLYFDDYDNSAMKQKEDGVDNRKKYRIRSYHPGLDETFHLEIKYRLRDKVRKEVCDLTRDETLRILEGMPVEEAYSSGRIVLRQFELARDSMFLHAAVIVEYDRIPYVYSDGNVRITIDRNICASPHTEAFMRQDLVTVPILERGVHLLEIKYDEYLPGILRQAIQVVNLEKTSFSKFYLCRLAGKPLRMAEKENG